MFSLPASTVKRGLVILSNFVKTVLIPFKIFNMLLWDILYSMILRGMSGCLSRIIPTFINSIASPNGVLLPGIDTGNRKGAIRIRQDSKPPCSPMSSKKSLKFIPSPGISLEILETESDALFFSRITH